MEKKTFEQLCEDIDALVGKPEDETPEDKAARHKMMVQNAEHRAKRKAAGVAH